MTSRGIIEVTAAPSEVFELICDFADPPPLSTIHAPEGAVGPGAVYEVRTRALGRRFTHVFAVHRWTPPAGVEFRSFGRPQFAFSVAYQLTPVAGVTRVELTLTVTPRGLWRLTGPLVRRILDQTTDDALERLRHRSEATPAAC
jgi:Polyketide cyclase / dehydrase and lipid transport